jgi:hypothetical protein
LVINYNNTFNGITKKDEILAVLEWVFTYGVTRVKIILFNFKNFWK